MTATTLSVDFFTTPNVYGDTLRAAEKAQSR
jgi:hypothetical protein